MEARIAAPVYIYIIGFLAFVYVVFLIFVRRNEGERKGLRKDIIGRVIMDWRNGRRRPLERRISIEFPSFPLNVRAESYISRAQFSQGRKRGRKEGTTGDELGALRSMNYAKSNYISCYTSGKVPLYISRRRRRGRVDERI